MVVVVVLPLLELVVVQMDVVANAALIQELVELLAVNSMRALHLAVEAWSPWSDVHVLDLRILEMPMKFRLELSPIVRLHHEYAER